MNLTELSNSIHTSCVSAGWWNEPFTGEDLKKGVTFKYVLATKIGLIHSEVSEALEGLRKGTMDDHLPHRATEEAEMADVIIRVLDYCGARGYDIQTTVEEKLEYNKSREDHKPETRFRVGGKLF